LGAEYRPHAPSKLRIRAQWPIREEGVQGFPTISREAGDEM